MKHNIILTKKSKTVNGTVQLTGSKSECNRALVIEALSNGKVKVENVSDAADTVTLAGILRKSAVGSKQLAVADGSDKSEIENSEIRNQHRSRRYGYAFFNSVLCHWPSGSNTNRQ
jgi:3-phosphoshikimate 1-carboxyvinyltransferase